MTDYQNIPGRWFDDVGGDSIRKAKRSKRVSDDDEYLAGCLVALAQSGGDTSSSSAASVEEKSSELSHRCSICGKGFRTHQALGGHKASHRSKPPAAAAKVESFGKPSTSEASDYTSGPHPSRGLHTCATCGKSFSMGQALGGHMRKHYSGVVGRDGGLKSGVNSSDGGNASSGVTSFSDGGAVSYSGGGAPSTPDFDLRFGEDIELDLTLKL